MSDQGLGLVFPHRPGPLLGVTAVHREAVNTRYRPDTHRGCPLVNDGDSVAVDRGAGRPHRGLTQARTQQLAEHGHKTGVHASGPLLATREQGAASSSGQPNSPALTPAVNADHCAALTLSAGPDGSLLSRTARPSSRLAISTQAPPWPLL